jgi:protein-S-isoprenylcysteine O-methyltransferase Ste14
MIWGVLFVSLILLVLVASRAFIPRAYGEMYFKCPKDATCYLASLFFHATWVLALAQALISPSGFPDWIRFSGAALFIAGHTLVLWARIVNPFFMPSVIIPDYIVADGPYRWMKHPGYIGMSLAADGTFFLLGEWWAALPTLAYQCVLGYRAYLEDRTLSIYFHNYQ